MAQRFYTEFVPELRDVIKKGLESGDRAKADAARNVQTELDQILNSEMHRWFVGKMTPAEREERRKAADVFKKRYAQQ